MTTLNTPSGRPPSASSSAKRSVVSGVVAGRLGDDGVAGDERRRELVAQQRRREVPRHDRADHAERPAQHVARRRPDRGPGVCAPRSAFDRPDVVHQRVDRLGDLDPRVAQRLALLAREQRDQLVEVLLDVVARRGRGSRRAWTRRAPTSSLRAGGRLHGGVDVGGGRGRPPRRMRCPSAGLTTASGSPAFVCCAPAMNEPAYVVMTVGHAPTNSGVRFSTNACSPSSASLERNSCSISSRSSASPSSSGLLAALVDAALDRGCGDGGTGGKALGVLAHLCVSPPRRRTRRPRGRSAGPPRRRSVRPVRSSSSAGSAPIRRVSRWVPPLPGSRPSVTSGRPSL